VSLRLQIIIGSTRPGRFADKPVAWLVDRLSDRDDFELDVLDLRDHPLPFFDSAMSPARSLRDYPNEEVAKLDFVFPEFNKKPMTFVGYGNAGGARSIEQLRLVSVEFEMAPLRHAVHIFPDVMRPAMTAEEFTPALFESLDDRLEMMINELVWWATALKDARDGE
jgi:NAD(P)H-dependent FMN reductase